MNLKDYRLIFIAIGLIGLLIIASPSLASVIKLPPGEQFSELYILGPNHMAENYPFNIVPNENYTIYVGVGNNMGASDYFIVYVKLLNASDILPGETSSPVNPLFEYRFFMQNEQIIESKLSFSISQTLVSNNRSIMGNININDIEFKVDKQAIWNSTYSMFHYRLLFELWKYNNQSGAFEYSNRYVNLQLNLTRAN